MPYRRISITFVVLALVAALLTSLLPPTAAERKDRATGKPVTSGEEASRGKERSHGKQRDPRDAHPRATERSTDETLSSDDQLSDGKERPTRKKRASRNSDSKTRETSTDEEVISSQEDATADDDAGGKEAVIVEVAPGANPQAVARALDVVPTHVYTEVFQGFAGELPAAAVRAAGRQRGVVAIWPDLPVRAEAQTIPTGVDRVAADENAWADINADGGSIEADVAVLDTGIEGHPDLTIAGGKACMGSGYGDGNGHGTHVAGTIAAKDDTEGVVGVAPGARLWAVKVLDNTGAGKLSTVICGLDWVVKRADIIDVVNMSVSAKAERADQHSCAGHNTTPLHKAICRVVRAGVPVVAAAGNQGGKAGSRVPATYPEVITVSAFTDVDGTPGGEGESSCTSDNDDTFASFSNDGPDVDMAAPGVCIRSTWFKDNYRTLDGTSMAAAHVTGAVALYIAQHSGATVGDVRTWLESEASRPNASPFGFSGDPDGFDEGVLYLGPP
jgi:subtilisin